MNEKYYNKALAKVEAENANREAFILSCKQIFTARYFIQKDEEILDHYQYSTLIPQTYIVLSGFLLQLGQLNLHCAALSAPAENPEASYLGMGSHLFGHLQISDDFGHVLITPTSTEQKIISFFRNPKSRLTKDKQFLKKFQVEEAFEHTTSKMLPAELTQKLLVFDELHVELNGNHCFFLASLKGLSVAESERFIALSGVLLQHLVK